MKAYNNMCYYMLSSQGDIALVFGIISVFMTVRAAARTY